MSENEYKQLVLADYDRKVAAGLLSAELISPAPGTLKSESVKICEQRFAQRDEIVLRSFFNQKDDAAAYRMAIQNTGAEIFRPLSNFLRDRSINTSLKNINLLAWLINFEPRPYHPNLTYTPPSDAPSSPFGSPPLSASDAIGSIPSEPHQQPLMKRIRKTIFYSLAALIIAMASYITFNYIKHQPTGREGCMIWQEDHYQPIDCKEKPLHTYVYPINHQLVDNFRKITKPDTLTLRSIGKVWYAKFNGRVEFFTSGGPYPLDSDRRVLPMSNHILEKYVYHIAN